MASVRSRLASLALLSLSWQAEAVEDAAALIQTHAIQADVQALPAVGADGVTVSRVHSFAEAGSMWFYNFGDFGNYSHKCEDFDGFGPKECAIYYNEPFHHTVSANLGGGVKSGDSFYQSYSLDLSVNESDFFAFLVPEKLFLGGYCTVCEESCSWLTADEKFSLGLTFPTVWEDAAVCGGSSTKEEFLLVNSTSAIPQPPATLALSGTVTETVAVYDKDNNTRLSGSYAYTLSAPSMLAARPEQSGLQQLGSDPRSLPGALLGWVTDAMQATRRAKSGRRGLVDRASKSLTFDLVVKDVNAGSSVSINASTGCSSPGSRGSISCEFGLGENVTLSTALNLGFTAVENGTLYTSKKFHIGGNLSMIADLLLPKTEHVSPLCGEPGSGYSKCGFYRFDFSTVPAEIKMGDDFASFDFPSNSALPFLPQNFEDILPISYTQEMEIRNPDNSTIIALEVTLGLKKAGA